MGRQRRRPSTHGHVSVVQLLRLDFASLASLGMVAIISALVGPLVILAELVYAGVWCVRQRFQFLETAQRLASARTANGHDPASKELMDRLLDVKEGHLEVLRASWRFILAGWFENAHPRDLQLQHVREFVASFILGVPSAHASSSSAPDASPMIPPRGGSSQQGASARDSGDSCQGSTFNTSHVSSICYEQDGIEHAAFIALSPDKKLATAHAEDAAHMQDAVHAATLLFCERLGLLDMLQQAHRDGPSAHARAAYHGAACARVVSSGAEPLAATETNVPSLLPRPQGMGTAQAAGDDAFGLSGDEGASASAPSLAFLQKSSQLTAERTRGAVLLQPGEGTALGTSTSDAHAAGSGSAAEGASSSSSSGVQDRGVVEPSIAETPEMATLRAAVGASTLIAAATATASVSALTARAVEQAADAAASAASTAASDGNAGGSSRGRKLLRLLLPQHDRLTVAYRPLTFYLVMEVVATVTHLRLHARGFKKVIGARSVVPLRRGCEGSGLRATGKNRSSSNSISCSYRPTAAAQVAPAQVADAVSACIACAQSACGADAAGSEALLEGDAKPDQPTAGIAAISNGRKGFPATVVPVQVQPRLLLAWAARRLAWCWLQAILRTATPPSPAAAHSAGAAAAADGPRSPGDAAHSTGSSHWSGSTGLPATFPAHETMQPGCAGPTHTGPSSGSSSTSSTSQETQPARHDTGKAAGRYPHFTMQYITVYERPKHDTLSQGSQSSTAGMASGRAMAVTVSGPGPAEGSHDAKVVRPEEVIGPRRLLHLQEACKLPASMGAMASSRNVDILAHASELTDGPGNRTVAAVTDTESSKLADMTGSAAESTSCTNSDSDPAIVFLHGIGLGLTPYVPFLDRLALGGQRHVIAVQYRHVSMRLTAAIPSPQEVAGEVVQALEALGVTHAHVVAHSYGTLVASALLKLPAGKACVQAVTLIDPVCFALFLPTLVRGALYLHLPPVDVMVHAAAEVVAEGPAGMTDEARSSKVTNADGRRTGSKDSGQHASQNDPAAAPAAVPAAVGVGQLPFWSLRRLLRGLVVRDFHCAVALCRQLDWRATNLWPSELPPHTTLALSGADHLVPVSAIQAMMQARSLAAAAATEAAPGSSNSTAQAQDAATNLGAATAQGVGYNGVESVPEQTHGSDAGSTPQVILYPQGAHGSFLAHQPFQQAIVDAIHSVGGASSSSACSASPSDSTASSSACPGPGMRPAVGAWAPLIIPPPSTADHNAHSSAHSSARASQGAEELASHPRSACVGMSLPVTAAGEQAVAPAPQQHSADVVPLQPSSSVGQGRLAAWRLAAWRLAAWRQPLAALKRGLRRAVHSLQAAQAVVPLEGHRAHVGRGHTPASTADASMHANCEAMPSTAVEPASSQVLKQQSATEEPHSTAVQHTNSGNYMRLSTGTRLVLEAPSPWLRLRLSRSSSLKQTRTVRQKCNAAAAVPGTGAAVTGMSARRLHRNGALSVSVGGSHKPTTPPASDMNVALAIACPGIDGTEPCVAMDLQVDSKYCADAIRDDDMVLGLSSNGVNSGADSGCAEVEQRAGTQGRLQPLYEIAAGCSSSSSNNNILHVPCSMALCMMHGDMGLKCTDGADGTGGAEAAHNMFKSQAWCEGMSSSVSRSRSRSSNGSCSGNPVQEGVSPRPAARASSSGMSVRQRGSGSGAGPGSRSCSGDGRVGDCVCGAATHSTDGCAARTNANGNAASRDSSLTHIHSTHMCSGNGMSKQPCLRVSGGVTCACPNRGAKSERGGRLARGSTLL